MRPLRLEVEGFTCYRDPQPALEFSGLTLFAIAGPTGAGKSSILDAMLYALFGEVPRIGKHGISEFISQSRDRMSVALDFRVRNHDFRVTRVSRQLKTSLKTDATLAELTAAGERSIASQVKQVNEEIVKLLGLGYDEFIQTVVLPQGEFAKFLKAKPADQRSILQHLLRHDVFTRMRDLAEDRRREMDAEMRGLDGTLSGLAAATDEALATSEKALAEARTRQANAANARDEADLNAQDARVRRKLTEELEQLRTQRGALEKEAAKVEHRRRELDQARRASAIVPLLEAFRDAASKVSIARESHSAAERTAQRAAQAKEEADQRAAEATEAARECAPLSERLRKLDAISTDIMRRAQLGAELNAAEQRLSAAATTLQNARTEEEQARIDVQIKEQELHALPIICYVADDGLLDAIESSIGVIAKARTLQQDMASLQAKISQCDSERLRAENGATEAQQIRDQAKSLADAENERLDQARALLEDGRDRDRAASIRSHLHAGEACPVCLRTVTEIPAAATPPELASLLEAVHAAEQRAAKAADGYKKAETKLATATAKRDQTVNAASAVAAQLTEVQSALTALVAQLAAIIPTGTVVERAAVLDWLEERRKTLRDARIAKERWASAMRAAEMALATVRQVLTVAESKVTLALARYEHQVEERARVQADLEATINRIHSVSTHADPQAERKEIAQRVVDLQAAERRAVAAQNKATTDAKVADTELTAAATALTGATTHVQATEKALAEALTAASFTSADAAAEAVRTSEQQRALERAVSEFDQKRAGVLQRLADLEPQVSGREMSAEGLAEIERQTKAAVEASRDADQAVAKLESEVTRLRDDVKERAALVAQKDALQKKFAISAELAADLKGDRFQEYLLEEAFTTLVVGASVRLKAISNRYTLQWESGEFYVVDHDNAGERRRAETLSGGETFMASLCLALQLSDEVLRTSGALQMDSLFIDEGFGTLDSDSLSEVTDAMEALRQEGDRMIGVISHRPELTDRLPGCIRVNKGTGESSWVLERVG